MLKILTDNRVDRWKLLAELISQWFPPGEVATALDDHRINDAARRLRINVPIALREWYVQFGNLQQVWSPQDHFLPPESWINDGGILEFCRENQAVVHWGARLNSTDDPPVVIRGSGLPDGDDWAVESPSVSLFAIQFALLNVKFSSLLAGTANGELTPRQTKKFLQGFERINLPTLNWPGGPTSFFQKAGTMLEMEAGCNWVWLSSRDGNYFDEQLELAKQLGITWVHAERRDD